MHGTLTLDSRGGLEKLIVRREDGGAMSQLDEYLEGLTDQHRNALDWFRRNRGKEVPWPGTLPDGTNLVTQAKGIYKPKWCDYALSVRQTLNSPYPDRDPVHHDDGTWTYAYYQEGDDPAQRDDYFTNRGLLACRRDQIPVGVIRQTAKEPRALYRVLGLALVATWDDGHFYLEGVSPDGVKHSRGPRAEFEELARPEGGRSDFDPNSIREARERTFRSIAKRRGQWKFREQLLKLYDGECVLTGCTVESALEAAHIVPYRGTKTNHPSNGLLLRSDVHTLFDLGLLSIDPKSLQVVMDPSLEGTSYGDLKGTEIPSSVSREALTYHHEWSGIGPRGQDV